MVELTANDIALVSGGFGVSAASLATTSTAMIGAGGAVAALGFGNIFVGAIIFCLGYGRRILSSHMEGGVTVNVTDGGQWSWQPAVRLKGAIWATCAAIAIVTGGTVAISGVIVGL